MSNDNLLIHKLIYHIDKLLQLNHLQVADGFPIVKRKGDKREEWHADEVP